MRECNQDLGLQFGQTHLNSLDSCLLTIRTILKEKIEMLDYSHEGHSQFIKTNFSVPAFLPSPCTNLSFTFLLKKQYLEESEISSNQKSSPESKTKIEIIRRSRNT